MKQAVVCGPFLGLHACLVLLGLTCSWSLSELEAWVPQRPWVYMGTPKTTVGVFIFCYIKMILRNKQMRFESSSASKLKLCNLLLSAWHAHLCDEDEPLMSSSEDQRGIGPCTVVLGPQTLMSRLCRPHAWMNNHWRTPQQKGLENC